MKADFEASRPVTFSLLRNPFVILGIHPGATNEEVLAAFEDALAAGDYSESELNEAKQSVLNPRLRLHAELSCLLDIPAETARTIYERLRKGERVSELDNVLSRLAPLSKINLIAHLASTEPCTSELLASYITARQTVSTDIIHSAIARLRRTAKTLGIDLVARFNQFERIW